MMLSTLLPVRSLLLAIFMLMAGSGFLATLISIRLERAGISALMIGLVGTAYFAGLTVGSLRVGGIIQRVGHVRAFAAFVSVFSASALAYAIHRDVVLWAVLRFIDGFTMAGVFICLESWLNERAEQTSRGAILASYMISLYSGQAIGQFLLNLSDAKPSMPFMAAAILLSLAVVPVALARIPQPVIGNQPPLGINRLYRISPLGVVGATVTGLMLGGFYALGAVYVRRLGMDLSATAFFMSIVILGGVALQWPLGWLSDRLDRRKVIVGSFVAAFLICAAISATGQPGGGLLILGALFGGVSFALYPLCVAHTNDRLAADERVGASGGLVLAYSLGAAIGPLAGAAAMAIWGNAGLFIFIGASAMAAAGVALWRLWAGMAIPNADQHSFQVLPRTTPMAATLDPQATGSE